MADIDVTEPIAGDERAAAAMAEAAEWIAPSDDEQYWLFLARSALSAAAQEGDGREDLLVAASFIQAYRQLVALSIRDRNERIASLRRLSGEGSAE